MTTIEGTHCKLEVLANVDRNRQTDLYVTFRRPQNDKYGDFYTTKVSITDPVDGENYSFRLGEIYAALKETGRLTFQTELSKAQAKLQPMDDFLLSLLERHKT